MRVLVVDDEVRNAELTALDLRDAGHDAQFLSRLDGPVDLRDVSS